MSVKLMTTDQIHLNLATIANMWPGGIPTEQYDQINALKSELKRRGVDAHPMTPTGPQTKPVVVEGMTMEQLQKELEILAGALGKTPNDEGLQERFANVRFELRQRLRNMPVTNAPLTQTVDSHPADPILDNNNGNGHAFQDGAVSRQTTQMPRVDPVAQAAARAQQMHDMEQLVRKHNLAKLAAESASQILMKYADPNGDDIDNACTIGLAVANKIFEKVGL